ncbi:MAG: lipoate--protein ligase family protein [Staphylothermus sp.]|nr:lipoate--protein ligase family protein [Staphylothermus sp.]
MSRWRLIINKGNTYWNMAVDEAILLHREKNLVPNTLRIYIFEPSGVTIGYFQKAREVLNLDYLLQNKIDFTRRITGGGAVYHDSEGEITYSVIADIEDISRNIVESYKIICMGLIYALRKIGLKAVYKPVNDILVNNKKISGNAQTRKKKSLLQHGTLMYNTNLDMIENTLRPPKVKLENHGVTKVSDRVTTIYRELGRKISIDEIINALIQGFRKALNIDELVPSDLSVSERRLAEKLYSKYESKVWIYMR